MSAATEQPGAAEYRAALAEHLAGGGERTLVRAYDIGRAHIEAQASVLDLAALHQESLTAAVERPSKEELQRAAEFFAEALSAYDMIGRGYLEANARLATLNQELSQRNRQLLELSQFKDEMTALIVHDLKNPLSIVSTNLDYILETEEFAPTHDIREALSDAKEGSNRLLRLVGNLLDIMKLEEKRFALHKETLVIRDLLRRIGLQRAAQARSHGISIEVGGIADATLCADRDLLTRVLENITDNAIRFTPRGGRIRMGAEYENQRVRIRVENTGAEIPASLRERIFEKFSQGDTTVGRFNAGLGLYFCRLATEAHGGRIWVDSTADFPTVFSIELPGHNRASERTAGWGADGAR